MMGSLEVDRESVEELFELEESSLEPEESSMAVDFLGQNRDVSVPEASRTVSYLDYPELVVVLKNDATPDLNEDFEERTEKFLRKRREAIQESKRNGGFRDEEFYEGYYNVTADEVEIFSVPMQVENLDDVAALAGEVQTAMDMHPEYSTGYVRFGTGFENGVMPVGDMEEALDQVEEALGFQVFFQYSGDADANEVYDGFQSSNPLVGDFGDEGVTGVACLGRNEVPTVYMAGPGDIEVEMEGLPGYDGEVEVESLASLI
jgi:hypothetical protein